MIVRRRRVDAAADSLLRYTGPQFLFGLAIFPLLLMIGSPFSARCLDELIATNRMLLCSAGFVALFTLLEDKSR